MEIALIKKYNSANRLYGYNISLGGINSRKCSDETKEKLRKVNIGKKMSDSTKKKISDFQKGCKRSEETILHMREAQKKNFKNGNNKFHSKESRKKASQSLKGRKPSDLSIQKSSEAKYHKVINIETGKQYKSIKEASQIEKIDRTTISRHCNKKTKIQKWVYVD